MREMDARFGIRTVQHRDARAMLDTERLDVVSVCTWHTGHSPWTVAAAARRPKAILCEKPMADTLGHADEMVVACHRNGVKLAIGHQRRFLPSYTLARDLIAQGAIGHVSLILSFGGQGLPNYSSHQTDMFRYLLGDKDCRWVMGNVERKTDRFERTTRIEDAAVAVFEFDGGVRALILADVAPILFQGAQIYGTDGQITLTTEEVQVLNAETGGTWRSHRPDGRFVTLDFEWREGGAGQAAELADWITGAADTHRGRAENGYKALEMRVDARPPDAGDGVPPSGRSRSARLRRQHAGCPGVLAGARIRRHRGNGAATHNTPVRGVRETGQRHLGAVRAGWPDPALLGRGHQ